MANNEKVFTLITGGSMGIGKAFAFHCASRGMNLLIVALPEPELENTAQELKNQFHIEVYTLALDLSKLDAPEKVYSWCLKNNYKINFLINNAGIAGTSPFYNGDPSYFDSRIMVNIRALTLLCHHLIPLLQFSKPSYILNIGSLSAYYPIPFKSVYSASKAYVLRFSLALAEELNPLGIHVSVVCPNGVETNSGTYGRIKAHGIIGRISKIDSNQLAVYTISRMLKGKRLIIPKTINRILIGMGWLIPQVWQTRMLKREFLKELKVTDQL